VSLRDGKTSRRGRGERLTELVGSEGELEASVETDGGRGLGGW